MVEETNTDGLRKCWWCDGFYRGPFREHICADGTTYLERLSRPYKVYDAEILDLTPADRNLLIGMKIKP